MTKKLFYSILLITLGMGTVCGQLSNSFQEKFLLQDLPEEKRLYFSLPTVNTTVLSNGFNYLDMYVPETKTLDFVLAAQTGKDFDLTTNIRASYGALGFRFGKLIAYLGHEWTADISAFVPSSVFDVLVDGNAQFQNSTFRINPSINLTTSHRWTLGGMWQSDRLHLGGFLHIYQGQETFITKSNTIDVTADLDFFNLSFEKDIELLSASVLDYRSLDEVNYIGNPSLINANPFTENLGFGLSLQASVDINDNLTVFGKIDDLGSIVWTRQAVTYTDKSTSSFNGVDISQAYIDEAEYNLEDTLKNLLTIDREVGAFTSGIPLSMMGGLCYTINDKFSVAGHWRAKQSADGLRSLMMLHADYQILPSLRLNTNYSFAKGAPFNIGVGLNYVIADAFGIYLQTINPWQFGKFYDSNLMHLNFGMYLAL